MAYESVDQLQKMLTEKVFHYAKDSKKAAGRALGTLVEMITFYLLKTWGIEASVAIERGLAEYGNPDITHNVEYSLHPIKSLNKYILKDINLPITSSKILSNTGFLSKGYEIKHQTLLSTDRILRNSCVIGQNNKQILLGLINSIDADTIEVQVVSQYRNPYAMFECKRVGIEEGNKKGPQTIEKAKQGAYVARSVSSLQKIRLHSGELYGIIPHEDGTLYTKPYRNLINEIIDSSESYLLKDFILTVGVVSNHGNWFTSGNQNKELMVLSQSYDWLIFLTDRGLSEFISDILISPDSECSPAKAAFLNSYCSDKKKNQFTKVKMNIDADNAIKAYFKTNIEKIESWFNIIAPEHLQIKNLKSQLEELSKKDWDRILE